MLDSGDLLNTIKRAAKETIEVRQLCDFYFGKVISTKPLKIFIDQKMTLGPAQLILTRNVTDFKTGDTTIYNALKVNEMVVLLKQSGGQRYLVFDRVVLA